MRHSLRSIDIPLFVTIMFIVTVFVLGGGSRHDITSLALLRPISVVALTYAALVITRDQLNELKVLWVVAVLAISMVAFHILPLPPAIWMLLPNRELAQIVGQAVGIEQPWRPISLVPYRTFNTLFSLFVPVAVLALMTKLTKKQQYLVLPPLIIMGLISALIGVLQLTGPPGGLFYFYKITNDGSPVGLFSNRNHHSTFLACCIPLLTALVYAPNKLSASRQKFLTLSAIFCGMLFFMVILVSGSRSGILLGLLGLFSVLLITGHGVGAKQLRVRRWSSVAILGVSAVFIFLSTWFARSESLSRITRFDSNEELRFLVWSPIFDAAVKYFPVGSGFGTFEEVYKVDEPSNLLSFTYLNHAHNDWLEIVLTGGLPAILLAMVCIIGWCVAAFQLFSKFEPNRNNGIIFGRLGVIVIFLLGVASIADYPLRTPSLSVLLVISAAWIINGLSTKMQSAVITAR